MWQKNLFGSCGAGQGFSSLEGFDTGHRGDRSSRSHSFRRIHVHRTGFGIMSQYQPSDHLEDLPKAECLRLLEDGSLGRIGAVVRGHPVIFPVNYVAFDGAIVFCTRRGGELETAASNTTVAFEIDGVDNIYHEGWSVLAIGRCIHVTDPVELDQIQDSRLSSWAGRGRDLLVRISMDEISGRRIRHHTP